MTAALNHQRQTRSAWIMLSPALILMMVILILPILIAFGLSFTDYGLGVKSVDFVGLENYERIFTRSTFKKMFTATVLYVIVVVPFSVGLGLGAALLIQSVQRGREFYKTIYFLPVMASLLAMAIVWEFMLHPTIGVLNETLQGGCDSAIIHGLLTGSWYGADPLASWYGDQCVNGFPLWLGDRDYALWTICFIGIWQSFGFNMVLYLAGLTSVPRDLYHAAEMDGASSAWERFRLITWPMLGPTTVFVVTITVIRSFQVFDTVEAIFPDSGGPGKTAYVMMFAIYEKGIKQNLLGTGAAITVIFLMFVIVVTLIQRWFIDRKTHYA